MEYVEDLQLNGLKIFRRDDLPGYTTDSVILADFVRIKPGQHICDLGTGTGIIPLLLLGREPGIYATGIEIDSRLADLTTKSSVLNKLEKNFCVVCGDIRHIEQLNMNPQSFDIVISNPPYFAGEQGLAHTHQQTCNQEDVVRAAKYLLKPGGYIYVSYPAVGLLHITDAMRKYGLEPKCLCFVLSRAENAPYLVLIRGKQGAKAGIVMKPHLVILDESGLYTPELKTIYHMKPEEPS